MLRRRDVLRSAEVVPVAGLSETWLSFASKQFASLRHGRSLSELSVGGSDSLFLHALGFMIGVWVCGW